MKFIQLTRKSFGVDWQPIKTWIAIDKITAITEFRRMSVDREVYTHIYAVDDAGRDHPWSVLESPEEILQIIDAIQA